MKRTISSNTIERSTDKFGRRQNKVPYGTNKEMIRSAGPGFG